MRWFKGIIVLLAVFALLAAIVFLGFVGIGLYVFSQMDGGSFLPPPQDCMLLERNINGRVQDKNGQPIVDAKLHIYVHNFSGVEGKVDLSITTNKAGRFNANGVDVFACDSLTLEVAAEGHATKEIEFVVAQEQVNSVGDYENYGDPDYTAALANGTTPVLPRQITIELP